MTCILSSDGAFTLPDAGSRANDSATACLLRVNLPGDIEQYASGTSYNIKMQHREVERHWTLVSMPWLQHHFGLRSSKGKSAELSIELL
jgi:hypothetical protein